MGCGTISHEIPKQNNPFPINPRNKLPKLVIQQFETNFKEATSSAKPPKTRKSLKETESRQKSLTAGPAIQVRPQPKLNPLVFETEEIQEKREIQFIESVKPIETVQRTDAVLLDVSGNPTPAKKQSDPPQFHSVLQEVAEEQYDDSPEDRNQIEQEEKKEDIASYIDQLLDQVQSDLEYYQEIQKVSQDKPVVQEIRNQSLAEVESNGQNAKLEWEERQKKIEDIEASANEIMNKYNQQQQNNCEKQSQYK